MLAKHVADFEGFPKRMAELVEELKADGHDRRTLSKAAKRSHAWVDSALKPQRAKGAGPGAIALGRLCEEYGYNLRWLVTGLGPKMIDRFDDERAARERSERPLRLRGTIADEEALRLLESGPRKR